MPGENNRNFTPKEPEQITFEGFFDENDNDEKKVEKKEPTFDEQMSNKQDIDEKKNTAALDNNVEPLNVKNKSEFIPQQSKNEVAEETKKRTLTDILLAPVRFIKFIIAKAIQLLDRITGYDKLVIKDPNLLATEENNKNAHSAKDEKTQEQMREEALTRGEQNMEHKNEAMKFEEFLNDTYGLNGRSFVVKPLQYEGHEAMFDIETTVDGNIYRDTIGAMSNSCLHTNMYKENITNELNCAWMKYTQEKQNELTIKNGTEVLRSKLNEMVNDLQDKRSPIAKHQKKAFMINGVYMYASVTSVLNGEPEITLRPYLVTRNGESSTKGFPGLEEKYTFGLSEISEESPKLATLVGDMQNASSKLYTQAFDRDMNNIIDKVVANDINKNISKVSPDLAEQLSVKPIGINKGVFELELTAGKDATTIKFNRKGHIVDGFDGPEKPLLETFAINAIAQTMDSNLKITPEELKANVYKVHDDIKVFERKNKDVDMASKDFNIGYSNVTISKSDKKDKNSDAITVTQRDLNDGTYLSSPKSYTLTVNSADREFEVAANEINKTNFSIGRDEKEYVDSIVKESVQNIVIERALDINLETLKSTEKDIDEVLQDANEKGNEELGNENRYPVEQGRDTYETSL